MYTNLLPVQTCTNVPIIRAVRIANGGVYIMFNEPIKPGVILERELTLLGTTQIRAVCIEVTQDDPILVSKAIDGLFVHVNKCIDLIIGIRWLCMYSYQEKLRDSWWGGGGGGGYTVCMEVSACIWSGCVHVWGVSAFISHVKIRGMYNMQLTFVFGPHKYTEWLSLKIILG